MKAVPPMYMTKFAEGTAVERAMNDMDEQGYEVVDVVHCGTKPIQNKLDPNQVALIPLFLVYGTRNFGPTRERGWVDGPDNE